MSTMLGRALLFRPPSTCSFDRWNKGKPCYMSMPLCGVGANLRVAVAKCPRKPNEKTEPLPYVSVTCDGPVCRQFGRPCLQDSDCEHGAPCRKLSEHAGPDAAKWLADALDDLNIYLKTDQTCSAYSSHSTTGRDLLQKLMDMWALYLGKTNTGNIDMKICGMDDVDPFHDKSEAPERFAVSSLSPALGCHRSSDSTDNGAFICHDMYDWNGLLHDGTHAVTPARTSGQAYQQTPGTDKRSSGAQPLLHLSCTSHLSLLPGTPAQVSLKLPNVHGLLNRAGQLMREFVSCRNTGTALSKFQFATRFLPWQPGMWLKLLTTPLENTDPAAVNLGTAFADILEKLGSSSKKLSMPAGCRLEDFADTGRCRVQYTGVRKIFGGSKNITLRLDISPCGLPTADGTANQKSAMPYSGPDILLDCVGTDCKALLEAYDVQYCKQDSDCPGSVKCETAPNPDLKIPEFMLGNKGPSMELDWLDGFVQLGFSDTLSLTDDQLAAKAVDETAKLFASKDLPFCADGVSVYVTAAKRVTLMTSRGFRGCPPGWYLSGRFRDRFPIATLQALSSTDYPLLSKTNFFDGHSKRVRAYRCYDGVWRESEHACTAEQTTNPLCDTTQFRREQIMRMLRAAIDKPQFDIDTSATIGYCRTAWDSVTKENWDNWRDTAVTTTNDVTTIDGLESYRGVGGDTDLGDQFEIAVEMTLRINVAFTGTIAQAPKVWSLDLFGEIRDAFGYTGLAFSHVLMGPAPTPNTGKLLLTIQILPYKPAGLTASDVAQRLLRDIKNPQSALMLKSKASNIDATFDPIVSETRAAEAVVRSSLTEDHSEENAANTGHESHDLHGEAGAFTELVAFDCSGDLHVVPQHKLLHVGADVEVLRDLLSWFGEESKKAATCHCPSLTVEQAEHGFSPSFATVIRAFEQHGQPGQQYPQCTGDHEFLKGASLTALSESIDSVLPRTCTLSDFTGGRPCTMQLPLCGLGITLQLTVMQCPDKSSVPYFSISCSGVLCRSLGRPCETHADCGSGGWCRNLGEHVSADVKEWLVDTLDKLRVFRKSGQSQCAEYPKGNDQYAANVLDELLTFWADNQQNSWHPSYKHVGGNLKVCGVQRLDKEIQLRTVVNCGMTTEDKFACNNLGEWDGVLDGGELSYSADRLSGERFPKHAGDSSADGAALSLVHLTCDSQVGIFSGTKLMKVRGYVGLVHHLLSKVASIGHKLYSCQHPGVLTEDQWTTRFLPWIPKMWLHMFTTPTAGYDFGPANAEDFYAEILDALGGNSGDKVQFPSTCTLAEYVKTGRCAMQYTGLKDLLQRDVTLRLKVAQCGTQANRLALPDIEIDCIGADCREVFEITSVRYCKQDSDCNGHGSCLNTGAALPPIFGQLYWGLGKTELVQGVDFVVKAGVTEEQIKQGLATKLTNDYPGNDKFTSSRFAIRKVTPTYWRVWAQPVFQGDLGVAQNDIMIVMWNWMGANTNLVTRANFAIFDVQWCAEAGWVRTTDGCPANLKCQGKEQLEIDLINLLRRLSGRPPLDLTPGDSHGICSFAWERLVEKNQQGETYWEEFVNKEHTRRENGVITLVDMEEYEVADSCVSKPCENGGTCTNLEGEENFRCSCASAWTGPKCRQPSNPCVTSPCLNGGSCTNPSTGEFKCTCAPGFEGQTCNALTNDCLPNPCQNGGKCNDTGIASFTCDCSLLTAFTGKLCNEPRRVKAVDAVLVLERDFIEDEEEQKVFIQNFTSSLASSLRVDPNRIVVLALVKGSIKVKFRVLPDTNAAAGEPTPEQAVVEIRKQLNDPFSPLRTSSVTAAVNVEAGVDETQIDMEYCPSLDAWRLFGECPSDAKKPTDDDESFLDKYLTSISVGAGAFLAMLILYLAFKRMCCSGKRKKRAQMMEMDDTFEGEGQTTM
eukprot:TRINITY_DN66558_c9_g11_i1.p1 TRINITY_DN66558_c9_g11~~TRINITY_DN66558_c9_g11_i1.p1  ORF type:complete len:2059 (-),score=945.11 TRINITY_DN66558_c9_g11_i1:2502-8180(-)